MIKLQDILNELNYGSELFGSVPSEKSNMDSTTGIRQDRNKDFIRVDKWLKNFKIPSEENTEEEDNVLKDLHGYLRYNEKEIQPSALKQLLGLKSKFPKMLDPQNQIKFSKVFRGMSMSMSELKEILKIYNYEYNSLDKEKILDKWFIRIPESGNIESQGGGKGFLSVSTNINKAATFSLEKGWRHIHNRRHPIVLEIPYSKVADRSLFNPSFINSFTKYDEYEFFILGKTLPYDAIWIPNFLGEGHGGDSDNAKEARHIIGSWMRGEEITNYWE